MGITRLALGAGGTATSLQILGPVATFGLPAVAVVAFWWNDWPGLTVGVALAVVTGALNAEDPVPSPSR